MAALVIAAICLAVPSSPAPLPQPPAAPTTVAPQPLDALDALAALFGGIAAGALVYSFEVRGYPTTRHPGRKAHLP